MASSAPNIAEYSVSELSGALKRSVEDQFGHVRVRGEISQFKRAASGHCYFRLKDESANLDAIIWRGVAGRLSMQPEDGLEVIATGKVTTYAQRSSYQIVIDDMAPAGKGALMALLEERRKALAAEGLFEAERKRPLPYLPRTIGVITSPTGAVIRDILHRLEDRFPRHVLVWPVAVQGEAAAPQIAKAITGFQNLPEGVAKPDVLILARGGGSLEDLWAFNEEIVVRAVAASQIPIITAVGHETDTTLVDFASDRRAPTPTAAAEMAVPVRADLVYTVQDLSGRKVRAQARLLDRQRERLRGLARGLPRPQEVLAQKQQRLDDVFARLSAAGRGRFSSARTTYAALASRLSPRAVTALLEMRERALLDTASRHGRSLDAIVSVKRQALMSSARALRLQPLEDRASRAAQQVSDLSRRASRAVSLQVSRDRDRLTGAGRLLDTLSYQGTLARGFAMVRGADGHVVRHAADVPPGADLTLEFADGPLSAIAGGKTGTSKPKAKPKPKPEQGSLF